MKIQRIDIRNFRDVRDLSWQSPADQTFHVLIGPDDATKSTILTPINPISIRGAVSDLPMDGETARHVIGLEARTWPRSGRARPQLPAGPRTVATQQAPSYGTTKSRRGLGTTRKMVKAGRV